MILTAKEIAYRLDVSIFDVHHWRMRGMGLGEKRKGICWLDERDVVRYLKTHKPALHERWTKQNL